MKDGKNVFVEDRGRQASRTTLHVDKTGSHIGGHKYGIRAVFRSKEIVESSGNFPRMLVNIIFPHSDIDERLVYFLPDNQHPWHFEGTRTMAEHRCQAGRARGCGAGTWPVGEL